MISDVLADAVRTIRKEHLSDRGYKNVRPQIEAVLIHMNAVRALLDAPPQEKMPNLNLPRNE